MGMFMTWKNEAFAELSKSEYEGLLLQVRGRSTSGIAARQETRTD